MITRTRAAWLLLPWVVCGCQHIAPSPLQLESIPTQLAERALDLPSINTYAEAVGNRTDVSATPYSIDDGVTLDEAKAIANWYNSDTRIARAKLAGLGTLPFVSNEISDPELAIALGEKETDLPTGVKRDWVSEVGIGITIPLSGRMGAARELGAARIAQCLAQLHESQWKTSRSLETAWLRWSVAAHREGLYDEQIEHFEGLSRITTNLADAGELSVINARFFQIEYTRLLATREQVRGDVESARLTVLYTMGLVPDAPIELHPLSHLAPESIVTEKLSAQHPTLRRLDSDYIVSEQTLKLELRKQYPDLTLTPTLGEEGDESTISLGFGLPLAVWNRNKLGIAQAVADRDLLRVAIENTYLRLAHDLEGSSIQYRARLQQWKHLKDHAVSLVEQQIVQARLLMDTGELNITILNELLRQSLQIRMDLLDALESARLTEIEVRAATQPEHFLSPTSMEQSL